MSADNSSLLASIQALGASIPEDEARRVPRDASTNLDAHLRRGMQNDGFRIPSSALEAARLGR